jgi:flagellar protein FlgJ
MWPHAQQAGEALGVDPSALVAQAALETGWGRAVPNHSDGSSFNLFGIKAGSSWDGATANVPTLEFEDGVAVRKVERFRAYASAADSFNDYAQLIGNNPRYENARGAGGDVATFASALQDGGYATDPNYAQKIVAVADEVRALTNNASGNSLKFASLSPTNGGSGGLRRF